VLVVAVQRVTAQSTNSRDDAKKQLNDAQLQSIWNTADVVGQQQKLLNEHQQAIDNIRNEREVFKQQLNNLTFDLKALRKRGTI
jgi:hypothetical protein